MICRLFTLKIIWITQYNQAVGEYVLPHVNIRKINRINQITYQQDKMFSAFITLKR
jgi:hypothetical protein